MGTEQDKSNKSETLKQPSKEAEIKPAKVEGQVAKVPARLTTKVNVVEDLEKVQIQIEFTGYQFEPEHLDVQLIDENVLVVSAEDGDRNLSANSSYLQNANWTKLCQNSKLMTRNKQC